MSAARRAYLLASGGVADRAGHDREIHGLAVEEHAAEHLARGRVGVVGRDRPVAERRALVDVAARRDLAGQVVDVGGQVAVVAADHGEVVVVLVHVVLDQQERAAPQRVDVVVAGRRRHEPPDVARRVLRVVEVLHHVVVVGLGVEVIHLRVRVVAVVVGPASLLVHRGVAAVGVLVVEDGVHHRGVHLVQQAARAGEVARRGQGRVRHDAGDRQDRPAAAAPRRPRWPSSSSPRRTGSPSSRTSARTSRGRRP